MVLIRCRCTRVLAAYDAEPGVFTIRYAKRTIVCERVRSITCRYCHSMTVFDVDHPPTMTAVVGLAEAAAV